MSNYRVIMSGNSGDGFRYRIEEISDDPSTYPFVQHLTLDGKIMPGGILVSSSVEQLKAKLKAMLEACDLAPMRLRQVEELVPIPEGQIKR